MGGKDAVLFPDNNASGETPISENGKTDPSRLRWDDVRVFLAIAHTGTLSGAAVRLGAGLATVSRQIERLESALGLTLFSRHQNGYRLTDDGAALLERAQALEHAAEVLSEGSAAQAGVAGRVRLATAETLANYVIIPALPRLAASYPDLTLEVVTDVQTVNLHRRDADLAVRLVKPTRGNVTIRRLGTIGFGLYGARTYMESRPQAAGDTRFEADRFITWCDTYGHLPAAQWVERVLRGRPPALATTTLSAQLSATVAGVGLGVLPHFIARRHDLACVQADLGIDREIWLAIHADLGHSRRIRVVAEFVTALIRESKTDLEIPPAPP
ncbi:LysR family transcriptional regulator [Pseudochelatococcus contaminans]|uniref:DNA-binding transcriptional LysR family regulator n=1 Tax=Pseudochelatococcus contaminans TaxID=1538103 RepID=A0A7W5Z337_9HYPH|nr:LysR family transcriptional regulator [Pseudochelatococcus contaminans]MBB3808907.1 DNA-binding transcriptional LysR family regulator [Pseudochelatococcus contaminans]